MRCFLIYILWRDAPSWVGQKSKVFALENFSFFYQLLRRLSSKKCQQLLNFSAQQRAGKNVMLYSPNNLHFTNHMKMSAVQSRLCRLHSVRSLSVILHKYSSVSELFIEACSGRKFLLSFFYFITVLV